MESMNELFLSVAQKYGVTPEDVRNTIEQTVRDGLKSGDPNIRWLYNQIPKKGAEASAEEIVTHFALIIARTKGLC